MIYIVTLEVCDCSWTHSSPRGYTKKLAELLIYLILLHQSALTLIVHPATSRNCSRITCCRLHYIQSKRDMKCLRTFSKLVATQSFLAVGELDDVQDLSLSHVQILPSWLLYDAVRIHHHCVQRCVRSLILGNNSYSDSIFQHFLNFSDYHSGGTLTCLCYL